MTPCSCGGGRPFEECCGPVIAGAPAATAEVLLRARYTAFVMGNIGFLADTLAPEVRHMFDEVEAEKTAANSRWKELDIRIVDGGGPDDDAGTVEFVAQFRLNGRKRIHHERAKFRRDAGRWLCAGGEINPKGPPRQADKVSRNAPCPCGSGKKYKNCCAA